MLFILCHHFRFGVCFCVWVRERECLSCVDLPLFFSVFFILFEPFFSPSLSLNLKSLYCSLPSKYLYILSLHALHFINISGIPIYSMRSQSAFDIIIWYFNLSIYFIIIVFLLYNVQFVSIVLCCFGALFGVWVCVNACISSYHSVHECVDAWIKLILNTVLMLEMS